jgi:hypothetical protein
MIEELVSAWNLVADELGSVEMGFDKAVPMGKVREIFVPGIATLHAEVPLPVEVGRHQFAGKETQIEAFQP